MKVNKLIPTLCVIAGALFATAALLALWGDIEGAHVIATTFCPAGGTVVPATAPVDCLEVCGVAADAVTVTGTGYCPEGVLVVNTVIPVDCLETCGAEMPAEMMRY